MLFLWLLSTDSGSGGVKCRGVRVDQVYMMWLRGHDRKREEGQVRQDKCCRAELRTEKLIRYSIGYTRASSWKKTKAAQCPTGPILLLRLYKVHISRFCPHGKVYCRSHDKKCLGGLASTAPWAIWIFITKGKENTPKSDWNKCTKTEIKGKMNENTVESTSPLLWENHLVQMALPVPAVLAIRSQRGRRIWRTHRRMTSLAQWYPGSGNRTNNATFSFNLSGWCIFGVYRGC